MKEYDLDFLIKTFDEHRQEYIERQDSFISSDFFNIAEALFVIVKEIKILKEQMQRKDLI